MRTALLFSFALSLSSPVLVYAQSNPPAQEDREKAKEFFKKAEAFYKINDYTQALENYKQSYLLSQEPILLYNMAQCYRFMGKSEEALRTYKSFLKDAPSNAKFVKEAKKFVKDLEEVVKKKAEIDNANPSAVGTIIEEPKTKPVVVVVAPVSQPKPVEVKPAPPEKHAPFLLFSVGSASVAAISGGLSLREAQLANSSAELESFAESAKQAQLSRRLGLTSDVFVGATLVTVGLAYLSSSTPEGASTSKALFGGALGSAVLAGATGAVALRAAGQSDTLAKQGSFDESAQKLSTARALSFASTGLGGLSVATATAGALSWKVEPKANAPKYIAIGSGLASLGAGAAALSFASKANSLSLSQDFEGSAQKLSVARVAGLSADVLGGVFLGSTAAAVLIDRKEKERRYHAQLSPMVGGASLVMNW